MDYRGQYYDGAAQYMVPPPQQAGPSRQTAQQLAQHAAPAAPTVPAPPPIRKDPDPSIASLPSQDRPYYYSSSDDESERDDTDDLQPTFSNRGNKLKRGARDVRRGRLGGWPKFGTDSHRSSKRACIDLTPTLSLTPRRDRDGAPAHSKALKLPSPPRNPVDLMTSPTILRTFAAPQSHLPTLALSAVTLIEADALLMRVLTRVCDVLRGDRVPFVEARVQEVKEERRRAIEDAKRLAAEDALRIPSVSAVRTKGRPAKSRSRTPEPAAEEDDEAIVMPGAALADNAIEVDVQMAAAEEDDNEAKVDAGEAKADIEVDPAVTATKVEGGTAGETGDNAMDVDAPASAAADPSAEDEAAATLMGGGARDDTRSSSPTSEFNASRRRSGRRAAAKATAANANIGRERSPSGEPAGDVDSDVISDSGPGLAPAVAPVPAPAVRQPEVLLEMPADVPEGGHLPPSLRRLANPDLHVRSLFITEDAPVAISDSATALDAQEQAATLQNSLMELNRFFADTVEYRERLGEIRDGALGVERRRKGLFAILKVLASDALEYEQAERDRARLM